MPCRLSLLSPLWCANWVRPSPRHWWREDSGRGGPRLTSLLRTCQGSTHSRACCECYRYRATYLTAEASRRSPCASPSVTARSSPQQFNHGEVGKRWCRLLLAIFGHERQSPQPRSLEMCLVRWIEATTTSLLMESAHEPCKPPNSHA